jgi:hypothetical protein
MEFPSHALTDNSTSTERLQKIGAELKETKSVEKSEA